jgi:hypothetical protein
MKLAKIIVGAAVALALAACSTSSSKPETSAAPAAAPAGGAAAAGSTSGDTVIATEILVQVTNDRIPPANYTIFVVGPSIGRIILGDLPMNQTKAFTFRAGNLNGYYRLIAQASGGGELPSQNFNLTPTLRFVQWGLMANTILQYATPK